MNRIGKEEIKNFFFEWRCGLWFDLDRLFWKKRWNGAELIISRNRSICFSLQPIGPSSTAGGSISSHLLVSDHPCWILLKCWTLIFFWSGVDVWQNDYQRSRWPDNPIIRLVLRQRVFDLWYVCDLSFLFTQSFLSVSSIPFQSSQQGWQSYVGVSCYKRNFFSRWHFCH